MATTEQLKQELTDLETRAYALDTNLQRIAAGLSIPTTEATMALPQGLHQTILIAARDLAIAPGVLQKPSYTALVDLIYARGAGAFTKPQIIEGLKMLGYQAPKGSIVPVLVAGTIVYFLSQ